MQETKRKLGQDVLFADLHVHTRFSPNHTFRALDAGDSYSEPEDVYRIAKRRGMDLVTFTDHDTIDGCLWYLDRRGEQPDFFISEEVETSLPGLSARIHVNVFDLDERQHREIQGVRKNLYDLIGYLRSEDLLFSLNHIFRSSRRDRTRMNGLMGRLVDLFDCFEVLNGSQLRNHNDFWLDAVKGWRSEGTAKAFVGGSDAHTLRRIGKTFTAAPATDRESFLKAIRDGRSVSGGAHGDFAGTAFDAMEVVLRYMKDLYFGNSRNLPRARRLRHMVLTATILPWTGLISGVSTAVSMRKQTKMIRVLGREMEEAGG